MKKKAILAVLSILSIVMVTGCGSIKNMTSSAEASDAYITISQYKGIEVVEENVEVTDEEVEMQIQYMLQLQDSWVEVEEDRAVQEGDRVIIDYEGKVDGEPFERGADEGYPLVIGSGSFIPGFEDGVIGHKVGETFDVELTFPEVYPMNEEMAGVDAVFTVTLHAIEVSVETELTDELVATVTAAGSTTVEEYREEIYEEIRASREESAKYMLEMSVWEEVLKNTEVKKYKSGDGPEERIDMAVQEYIAYAEEMGMTLEELLESEEGFPANEEALREELRQEAEVMLKRELIAELIAKKEKIEPTEEEYIERMDEVARLRGFESLEALKQQYPDIEDSWRPQVLQEKVATWLVENSKSITAEEKAAKDAKEAEEETDNEETEAEDE